ncbi:putative ATP-dependent RNA helicase prh1 [Nymphon striatum]|nr:putative ATP-dependent RNA helicase prh1 [Nymphon striatum]
MVTIGESDHINHGRHIDPTTKCMNSIFGKMFNPYTNKPYTKRYYQLLQKRKKLPVWQYKDQFMDMLHKNQISIVIGETGSGKTTQIPQWCIEFSNSMGKKSVACTQPRKISAVSIADRVSKEMDVQLGTTVGYSIRFENKTSRNTKLKYVTEEMLLREIVANSEFLNYGVIFFDEAHERSLTTDVLLAILKEKGFEDPNLRVVIMSATLESQKFIKYFMDAPVLRIPGFIHPVQLNYTPYLQSNYADAAAAAAAAAAVQKAVDIHRSTTTKGDILIFLTGQKNYDPKTRVESLLVTDISKASANQRKGRAGRTAPGICYRLYSENKYNSMEENTKPEILRSNLATLVLTLKKLGIQDVLNFDYIDAPDKHSIANAIEMLKKLKALDQYGVLLKLGEMMSDFPLEPQLSRMVILSKEFNCTQEILTIAAMLSVPNCYASSGEKEAQQGEYRERNEYQSAKSECRHNAGDHYTLLNVYDEFIENGKQWIPAKCIETEDNVGPRSYLLQCKGATFRRNRKDILQTKEHFNESDICDKPPNIETSFKEVSNFNNSEHHSNQEEMDNGDMSYHINIKDEGDIIVSKVSGRVIRKPQRYRDT